MNLQTEVVDLKTTNTLNTPKAEPVTAAEPAVTPPQATPAEKDPMSAKFAALARREREARQIHSRVKQKEEALLKREQEIAEREKMWETEFRTSPLEALKRRGIEYQDITNAALNDGKFDASVAVKTVEQKLEALQRAQEEKERRLLEQQKEQETLSMQETINDFKSQIVDHISKSGDKYELTHLFEGAERVYQVIQKYFHETQKVLGMDEACALVEQEFEADAFDKLTKAKKFQSRFAPSVKKDEPKAPAKNTTTLTNDIPSSAAPSFLPAATEADRMKRALAKLGV